MNTYTYLFNYPKDLKVGEITDKANTGKDKTACTKNDPEISKLDIRLGGRRAGSKDIILCITLDFSNGDNKTKCPIVL